jgi:hypothetical protein
MSPLSYILSRQIQWARRHRKAVDKYYSPTVDDNLFERLSPEAVEEFNHADGNEIRDGRKPAKMRALRSSSALVVNTFQYWRTRDLSVIAKACRIPSGNIESLRFERLTRIARNVDRKLFPRDPNVDVVFSYNQSRLREVGVESKFAEAYGRHEGIKKVYLNSALWDGIPNCRKLAEKTASPNANDGIDYAQLLKHVLGLKHLATDWVTFG